MGNEVVIFCDGSGTSEGPGGIGYVAKFGGLRLEGSFSLPKATNQQAEVLAAAYALDQLDPCEKVLVVSDSEYVVKGASKWVHNWIARGWRTSGGSDVKNRGHWERLLRAIAKHGEVEFQWCKGHNGVEENERADMLAGAARADEVQRQQLELPDWLSEVSDERRLSES